MSGSNKLIARRYAGGLLKLVSDGSHDADKMLLDLRTFLATLDRSSELKSVLYSPAFTRDEQKSAVSEVVKGMKLSAAFSNFILVLAENRRLFLLPDIGKEFETGLNRMKGISECVIESSYSMGSGVKGTIEKYITKTVGAQSASGIRFVYVENRELIGGFRAKYGDRVIDCSVDGALAEIKDNLFND